MTLASTSRYTLDDDARVGTRSIRVSDFHIESTKLPILTIPQADEASNELDLALPEIIFGNNRLSVRHEPTGFALEWNTLDALRQVRKGPGWDSTRASGAVRVAHADEWSRGQSSTTNTSQMKVVKPFDWTYTTLHPGNTVPPETSTTKGGLEWEQAPPTHPGIPLALLARTDIPILFFDEVPLFEDELGDNGIADVTIRVRVNATSFYVLARYALRIDHVLFRHYDVRVYHEFGSREIVRERKGRQSTYEQVKARLSPSPSSSTSLSSSGHRSGGGSGRVVPNPSYSNVSVPLRSPFTSSTSATVPRRSPFDSSPTTAGVPMSGARTSSTATPPPPTMSAEDLTKLTDPNWVASALEQIALEEDVRHLRVSADDAADRRGDEEREWEGKGRTLELLRVPWQ